MINRPSPLDGRRKRLVARLTTERRHGRRVKLPLRGRYMVRAGQEYTCKLIDISPGGLLVQTDTLPAAGAHVVLMLEKLGRLEGDVVRLGAHDFAVRLHVTGRKRNRLGDELTWLLNKDRLGLSDDRASRRSKRRKRVFVQTADGLRFVARSIEVSLTGMAIETSEPVRRGERIRVGSLDGVVVRRLARGFAVMFDPPDPDKETLQDAARGTPPQAALPTDADAELAPHKPAKAQ